MTNPQIQFHNFPYYSIKQKGNKNIEHGAVFSKQFSSQDLERWWCCKTIEWSSHGARYLFKASNSCLLGRGLLVAVLLWLQLGGKQRRFALVEEPVPPTWVCVSCLWKNLLAHDWSIACEEWLVCVITSLSDQLIQTSLPPVLISSEMICHIDLFKKYPHFLQSSSWTFRVQLI